MVGLLTSQFFSRHPRNSPVHHLTHCSCFFFNKSKAPLLLMVQDIIIFYLSLQKSRGRTPPRLLSPPLVLTCWMGSSLRAQTHLPWTASSSPSQLCTHSFPLEPSMTLQDLPRPALGQPGWQQSPHPRDYQQRWGHERPVVSALTSILQGNILRASHTSQQNRAPLLTVTHSHFLFSVFNTLSF